MTLLHRLASMLRWVVQRHRAEQDLHDELEMFVAMSAADRVRDGVPPEEARRQAVLELGGIEQAKESVRTYRHGGMVDEVARDVRYAFRMFARARGFTATVVATLALGIGANTAIFSLIDALMLRSLPVRNPQELVALALQPPNATNSPGGTLSYSIVRALDEQRDIFAGVAGFTSWSFDVGVSGSATRVPGGMVTGAYYETLGLSPVTGRLLTRQDDESGAAVVAVISDGYWERQFARRSGAVGETVNVNGVPVTIVGVSPRGFTGALVGSIADITMTAATLPQVFPGAAPLLGKGNFWLRVLARRNDGVSLPEATARLNAVWPRMSDAVIAPHWPASRRKEMAGMVFALNPGGTGLTYLRELYRTPLLVLMSVVALVLVIACANVASLLLARASARQKEIAVRLAIGAGRGRIARQLLIESTVLALAGAALGIGLAWPSGRLLVDLIATGPMPVVVDLTPNAHILGFTSVMAIATAILFGLAPALQTSGAGPSSALKQDVRLSRRSRLLPALVSVQVALSLVLLAGAGLFVRTLQNLHNLDPGFSAGGVLLVDLDDRGSAIARELLDDVQRLPGVMSAAVSTHTPLSGSVWSEPAVPAGDALPDRDTALFIGSGPGFFATMGIGLLSGRDFSDRDTAGSPHVAVVNEAFAQKFLPGRNPVGQRLSAAVRGQRGELEVVGLVRNTHAAGLRRAPPPIVYVAHAQLTGDGPTALVVRASGPQGRVSASIQQSLQAKLPNVPIEVRPLSAQVESTIVQERMMATLAGGFGALALTLACIGLYGLLAYSVVQRTKEIGIRMALGAQRTRVVTLVLQRGARLVAIGIAVGLPAAWAASRWVKTLLFGLMPADPVALGGAIVLLAAAGLVAAYVPALRASRVDPLVALRHE